MESEEELGWELEVDGEVIAAKPVAELRWFPVIVLRKGRMKYEKQ